MNRYQLVVRAWFGGDAERVVDEVLQDHTILGVVETGFRGQFAVHIETSDAPAMFGAQLNVWMNNPIVITDKDGYETYNTLVWWTPLKPIE